MLTDDKFIIKVLMEAIKTLIKDEADYEFQRGVARGRLEQRSEDQQTTKLVEQQRDALADALKQSKRLQDMTLTNQIRWMRKHDDLLTLIASIRDWKSPDGVLQVKDLEWFKDLPPSGAALALVDEQKQEPK